jgi:hypothetical protein
VRPFPHSLTHCTFIPSCAHRLQEDPAAAPWAASEEARRLRRTRSRPEASVFLPERRRSFSSSGTLSRCRTELHSEPPPPSSIFGRRRRSLSTPRPGLRRSPSGIRGKVRILPVRRFSFSPCARAHRPYGRRRRPPLAVAPFTRSQSHRLVHVVEFPVFPAPCRACPWLKTWPDARVRAPPASYRRSAAAHRIPPACPPPSLRVQASPAARSAI